MNDLSNAIEEVAAAEAAKKPKTRKAAAPKPKKAAPKKPKARAAAKAAVKTTSKTVAVVAMLTRKSGCTRAEVLAATGWTAISMQQVAKVARLKLTAKKDGVCLRYFGAAK